MHYLSADWIFPVTSPPIEKGIIIVSDGGFIEEIVDPSQNKLSIDSSLIQHYNGIICPGFINTHCHLELSHLKGAIPEKLGMAGFIREILSKRGNYTMVAIDEAIEKADQEMLANGIVAVGDISNTDHSFEQKKKNNIYYYTFLEVFDIQPQRAATVFEEAKRLESKLKLFESVSIVPHAPYSVSKILFEKIKAHAIENDTLISYHNQESEAESEFFSGKGSIYDLFKQLGNDMSSFPFTGLNSLRSTLPFFSTNNKTLLVHNTFTERADIEWAHTIIPKEKLYWCTCPNANLYIENTLPNYYYFIESGCQVTVGTDSLASNHSLSILDELKTISAHFPSIPIQTLLTWATFNGAKFLGIENFLGSIEIGKKPGLNLLTGERIRDLQLTKDTAIKVIRR